MSVTVFQACSSHPHAGREERKFVNGETPYKGGAGSAFEALSAWFKADRLAPRPAGPLPVRNIPGSELEMPSPDGLYRLGHSTVLIRIDGQYLLTDPVFSERASPVQWAGSKRFHPVPVEVGDLPRLRAVVISHDHYDHLDKATVLALDDKVDLFVTPLRVGGHLRRWGIDAGKIIERDWWQDIEIGSLRLTATPAQHFSGRTLADRDRTQWASWVIEGSRSKLFFSGDSGYFAGFREIGDRFGPFDVTMIETGAYNELWSDIHMLPEQSLQAHLDLRGRAMLPIHNSTFDLSLHDWFEPLERIQALARENGVSVLTPAIGERLSVKSPAATTAWWRSHMPAGYGLPGSPESRVVKLGGVAN